MSNYGARGISFENVTKHRTQCLILILQYQHLYSLSLTNKNVSISRHVSN